MAPVVGMFVTTVLSTKCLSYVVAADMLATRGLWDNIMGPLTPQPVVGFVVRPLCDHHNVASAALLNIRDATEIPAPVPNNVIVITAVAAMFSRTLELTSSVSTVIAAVNESSCRPKLAVTRPQKRELAAGLT